MNQGHTGIEIAEVLELPPALERAWHAKGYYGSVSHNVKAIYQRYLGWFDGNPANLWRHPPEAEGKRYVDCMGGTDAVVAKARSYIHDDDLRFAVELLNHVVFADPENVTAKDLLAETYTTLGFGSENATWRNFFLVGAQELREGVAPQPDRMSLDVVMALSVEQIFDAIAIRIDSPNAWDEQLTVDWNVIDVGQRWRTTLRNGVLIPELDPRGSAGDLAVTLTKLQLILLLFTGQGIDDLEHTGDLSALQRLTGAVDSPDKDFPIVTP
jgi:alkyl sulfatase BDS1-like metallo-beta-lactamase superfamily hydrolase